MPTERWRLLPYDRGPSLRHFALSDALVRNLQVPSLWWHATDTPTLILGAAQRPDLCAIPQRAETVVRVRRQAGGTAVLATSDVLGLDIALPAGHPLALPDVVEAYRWVGEVWAEALSRLGIEARVISVAGARQFPPAPKALREALSAACFGTLSPYEVMSGDRKLVGLAQVRRRAGALWQCGLHLTFDADKLAQILAPAIPELAGELRRRAAGLGDLTSRIPTSDQIFRAFADSLTDRLGVELAPGEWREDELEHAFRQAPPGG